MKNTHSKIEFGFGCEIDRNQVKLTVPEQQHAIAMVQRAAVGLFGSYTITGTRGGWTNPAGRLVEEQGATLMVLVPEINDDEDTHSIWAHEAAIMTRKIKEYFRQEAVAVTFTSVNFSIQ